LYNASKGGLIAWTKSAAVELAPYGIVSTAVAVGGFSTAMGSETGPTPEADQYMMEKVHRDLLPWGRLGTVDEIADVLADVACAKSHMLLGATIHASGGRVMPL
jgi:3-oxoacyl-[acyl-carrier protein] reductase